MKSNLRACNLVVSLGILLALRPGQTFSAGYPAAVLSDGPIAYYRFNDEVVYPLAVTATNLGSLGASANGTYMGGAAPGTEAPQAPAFVGFESDNTALQLDGMTGFVTTLPGLLNGKPQFTISGWIRRAADQGNRTGLFGQDDLVEFGYIDNNTLECWTDDGLDIPNPFPNGEWAYVAVVSDGSPGTLTMYTNGFVAGSRMHMLPADTTFPFNIGGGGIFDAITNFFNGQIDEVAVFDKPLSAQRIAEHYTSAKATMPTIFRQPQGTNVFEGTDVILSVGVIGTPPLHYQWLNFGTEIPNETNSTLVFSNITEELGSSYQVVITNLYGMQQSDVAEVMVMPTQPPSITREPQSASRYAGRTVVFKVEATGGAHLTYQWQSNEVDIAGATTNMLTFPNVQPSAEADYRVIVSNSAGSVTSMVATLTVILVTPGTYEALLLDDNPVAYWRLNEASGTVAHDYAGGIDGTYTDITLGVPGALTGNPDTAAEFNGTSSSVVTVPGLMNDRHVFTLCGWMRRAADQANRTGLWGQNDAVEFGYINNNTIQAWTDNGLDVSPNPIPNEQWGFLALVSEGSPGTLTTYVNGQAAASRMHVLTNNNNFTFNIGGGGIFDGTGNFFNGRIDEVALFDQALTPNQICALYALGSGAPLRIDVVPGGLIIDSKPSGTPHNGQNFSADWLASSTDAVSVTRDGVMQFAATNADQIILPPDPDFDSAQGAITFWMRSAGTVLGSGDFAAILFDRRPSNPGGPPGDVIVQQDDGHLFVQAASGSGGANSFSTVGNPSDDTWHHIAYVYDQSASGSITIYIDGVQDRSQNNSRAWAWTPSQRIELGRSHDSFWRAYNGQLDDFRIYNRILTAAEVADIASTGALVDAAALKVRFNFDALAGLTLTWTCGTLEATPSLNPSSIHWTTVVGALSPYLVDPSAPMQFYRLHP